MREYSRFLPEDFDPTGRIAVVAGQRDYPVFMVRAIRAAGLDPCIIALEGETNPELVQTFDPESVRHVKVGQIGRMLKALQQMGARYAVFVGQVTPGKLFRGLHPDIKALTMLAKLRERNAHTIFGSIAAEIERIGVRMLDARAFMDAHLATGGLMTGGSLRADQAQIDFGVRMAKAVAQLDIGQGVVVRKGTVLSVEAFEGTDEMLSRANKYKTDQLIFAKTTRPGQNPCFDWPVFGVSTLESMHASGIQTAALETDRVVMLDREHIIAQARDRGIELWGYPVEPSDPS